MKDPLLIQKASGELEPFSRAKLESSLKGAGASDEVIQEVSDHVEKWLHEGISTRQIYRKAFDLLRKYTPGTASRYRLKKALMELGPTGFPFEHFVAQIIKLQGYEVEVGQILQGHCVTHEVDVVATRNHHQFFVECKYYLSPGKNANVQVPLYIRSRVDDIIRQRRSLPEYKDFAFNGWVVTKTRFTTDAIAYGKCCGLHLLSWDYPAGNGLKDIIDREKIFPITVLTRLTLAEKHQLMERGIVICRQLIQQADVLETLGIRPAKMKHVLEEAKNLCSQVF